jgi:dTDP-4-amino-4,6-dideoxygalactose transaminase
VTFIGGFHGLELPPTSVHGLATFWEMPAQSTLTYANARSALAALLVSVRPSTLWLPAFICPSVTEATAATATPTRFFPVDEALQPDTPFLESTARGGDMILAVDYFGRPPNADFLDFVKRRPDLLFIEDACHAVDTGTSRWGRWCLRSPRKLVGVPDGGFIVPADDIAAAQWSVVHADLDAYQAACLRFEDEEGRANGPWHAANQRREGSQCISTRRMSRLSRELLVRLPVQPMSDSRRSNFRILAGMLGEYGYIPEDRPTFVPLGFPVRLRTTVRERVRADLIANGIFPAVHWAQVPSPASFSSAHALAAELLTLPCDQRYGTADMQLMAQLFMASVKRR